MLFLQSIFVYTENKKLQTLSVECQVYKTSMFPLYKKKMHQRKPIVIKETVKTSSSEIWPASATSKHATTLNYSQKAECL